ncbi:MAG TPA: beta-L-arabinofuranosidase domain-containing protein [Verrucomicrobiae bacterium]|jgi:hypothetical protein
MQSTRFHIFRAALILGSLAFSAAAQTPASDIHPVPLAAEPLPLSAVRLTGGPLQHAQELDAKYLLELQPNRMLYYLRLRAGLPNKTDEGYGGWDGGGRQLTGHIAGHYLSAVSYMYAATGDPRFKERADYIVSELKEVQDKQGDGYIGALMATAPRRANSTNSTGNTRRNRGDVVDGKGRFEELTNGVIQSGGFDLNGMWSPWYVEHKIFAGLRDAYHYTGNREALEVETKFAGWVESIVGRLTDAQDQRMLSTEFGGMNEVLADLYHDTGDQRWLALSGKFEHKAIVEPLAEHKDILGGKHGNTLVPKMIGELSRYIYTGNKTDGDAAKFFWEQVVFHHSYATGGHGHNEYFDPPDQLSKDVDGRDDESCNVYNMLKMSRELFSVQPDVRCADFMERALFNHVLASINPKDGRTCYMVPVGRGVTHEYQDMFESFTCCVGSGMENHALLGYGLYYESPSKLWVNFYAPSTAEWNEADAKVDMETTFPEGESASLTFTLQSRKKFTVALRRPPWAGENFSVKINGKAVSKLPPPGSYVEIKRTWKSGDTIALVLPKKLHEEALPDNPRQVALMWGPLVLAGDLGPEQRRRGGRGRSADVPVLVAAESPVAQWLKPVPGEPGEFKSDGVGRDKDVTFVPFYRLPERTYAIYWDTFTPAEWDKRSADYAAQQAREEKIKQATVGFAQPGQMQAERDYNMQSSAPEDSSAEQTMGRYGRRGAKWFSFDLPVDPAHPMTLVCTYYADEWRKRTFDILVDGQKLADQTIEARGDSKFYDVEYKIPAGLINGKTKVTIRFAATEGNEIGAVYGIRTLRADAAQ